jgi:hypothetical protein
MQGISINRVGAFRGDTEEIHYSFFRAYVFKISRHTIVDFIFDSVFVAN